MTSACGVMRRGEAEQGIAVALDAVERQEILATEYEECGDGAQETRRTSPILIARRARDHVSNATALRASGDA